MVFNSRIGAFCNLPLMLHKMKQKIVQIILYRFFAFRILPFIPQKNSANYPLPIFRILPSPQTADRVNRPFVKRNNLHINYTVLYNYTRIKHICTLLEELIWKLEQNRIFIHLFLQNNKAGNTVNCI